MKKNLLSNQVLLFTALFFAFVFSSRQAQANCPFTVTVLKLTSPGDTTCRDINVFLEAEVYVSGVKQPTGNYTYKWESISGTSSNYGIGSNAVATNYNITVSPSTSTNYQVTVKDANNCIVTNTVWVPVWPKPNISVIPGPSIFICTSGGTETLVVNTISTNAPIVSYVWTHSNGSAATNIAYTQNANEAIINPPSDKDYYVRAIDANGCISDRVRVRVYVDKPLVSVAPDKSGYCVGEDVLLTATGTSSGNPIDRYEWYDANGIMACCTTNTLTVNAPPVGNYTYTVKAFAGSCSKTASVTVTVNPLPNITLTASDSVICCNQPVQLTATGGSTYNWAPVTGLSATTGSSVTASPTATTMYTVTVTSAAGCTAEKSITVNVYPKATAAFSGLPGCIEPNESVTFGISVVSGIINSVTTSTGSGTLSPDSAGTYTLTASDSVTTQVPVYLTYTSNCGKTYNTTVLISVCTTENTCNEASSGNRAAKPALHPHAETPEQIHSKVYPNPSFGSFTIESSKTASYRIFNNQGSEIKNGSVKDGKTVIKTKSLRKGIYYLHIQNGNKIEKQQIVID